MRFLVALLCAALPAQVVRLANYSELPFSGWARTVVDTKPLPVGAVGDILFVRGRQTGLDTWAVDLRVTLRPNEQRTIDLGRAHRAPWAIGPLPADPTAFFGARLPTVNGTELEFRSIAQDGAGAALHFQGRLHSLWHVDLWLLWRPDEPGVMTGEVLCCASNPSIPDVLCETSSPSSALTSPPPTTSTTGTISELSAQPTDGYERGGAPYAIEGRSATQETAGNGASTSPDSPSSPGLRLSWGDALVHVPGAGWNYPVVPEGSFATGQARGVPVTLVWTRNIFPHAADTGSARPDTTATHISGRSAADSFEASGGGQPWLAAIAAVNRSVCAVGIARLWPDGNPTMRPGFNATAFTTGLYQESLRRLHTWEPPLLGPAPQSGTTGSQEDQVFVGGECFAPDGLGAEQVRYLNALRILSRPCHHLNADGTIVDPTTAVPRLIYWDGMAHWSLGVSPNRLGKPRNPTLDECHGWSGPDVEHWLFNQTAAAARLTGSHALQWELEHQAHLYLGQWTTTPGWSTTQPYAARAVGWEGIGAVHLYRNLENRQLAERVATHWRKRCSTVILPAWKDRDIVDMRLNDPRLGTGLWWIPWQQSVGAYGLDLACTELGPVEGRAVALRLARTVVRDAYDLSAGRWVSRAQQPVQGPQLPGDESFNGFGMPLSAATVLRHEPEDPRAGAIWAQTPVGSWTAPGVITP